MGASKTGRPPTSEYSTWANMIQRCHNPRNNSYRRYGARGIAVCQRWRDSFLAFLADMGPRPSSAYSIDRIDNSRGYEPSNCRWATDTEQSRNRSNVHTLTTDDGQVLSALEASALISIEHRSMLSRLERGADPLKDRRGWLRVDNVYQSLEDWGAQTGIPRRVIQRRLWLGWDPQRAVSQPVRGWGVLYPQRKAG